jgi:hypothetical protein
MAGFKFRYRYCGGTPTIQDILFKDTETLTKGDLINLETGKADLAATNDTNLLGAAQETKAGTEGVSRVQVITDADAVYGVTDANARKIGDTLDIAGATGAQGVAASSNKDVVVVADSSASEETLVTINADAHWLKKAQ